MTDLKRPADLAPLRALLAVDGVEESVTLAGPVGLMAFHGGALERMTDVIAEAAAARCGASTYVIRQPEHYREHLPSHVYDPADSPELARFLDHVEVAIAVHGYGRQGQYFTMLAGGANRALAEHVAACVGARLPDYEVRCDLDAIPRELRGLDSRNPVNRPRQGGVQLELPPRVRGLGPFWGELEGAPGLRPHTESLVEGLAHAVRSWPLG
jgi:phage replication-related protein YjqB (UPF0714/DUF867 family)